MIGAGDPSPRPDRVPGHGDGHGAGHGADSHGVPWAGRDLVATPFAGDDGRADPALAAALAGHAAGTVDETEVLAALAAARLLVPVVATVGEGHPLPDHLRGDAGADMSLPLLGGADGSRALPVFTGTAALTAWDPAARPVPVEAARAALSAVDEGCVAMVLDPGAATAFVVRRTMLWALARGRTWRPAHQDDEVVAAVVAAAGAVPGVDAVRLGPGRGVATAVVLDVVPGLDDATLGGLTREVAARLGDLPVVAERVEALELRPVPAATG